MKISSRKPTYKVNFIRYCDDFVITGRSKEQLENEVKPLVEDFLKERGLELSLEKTKITHIEKGFDFLGQTIRKYNGKLIITPSKSSVKAFLNNIRKLVKGNKMVQQEYLIALLNPRIRGWVNYHKTVCSKKTFSKVRHEIWKILWRWCKFRHPNKSSHWVKNKYFKTIKGDRWMFACNRTRQKRKIDQMAILERPTHIPIKRHIKIKAELNAFDKKWQPYIEKRTMHKMYNSISGYKKLWELWVEQDGECPICKESITLERGWDIHHLLERRNGGDNKNSNLMLLHPNCHRQTHNLKIQLSKLALKEKGLKRLEPDEVKASSPVLRGRRFWKLNLCYPTLIFLLMCQSVCAIEISQNEIMQLTQISKQNAAHYQNDASHLMNQLFLNAEQNKQNLNQKILVFVSFSMPKHSLKQWLMQAEKISAPVLLRGFKHNSLKETLSEFQTIQSETKNGIQIDPMSFEKFNIDKVPAVVIQHQNDFDVIYGDVGLNHILDWLKPHKKIL